MYYDPIYPVDVIFNKVEDLSDLSIAARADFLEHQLITIACVILINTGKYQTCIREWSRLQPNQKIWANFKTEFHQAHKELKEVGDLQLRETQFNSANLVQEVIDGVQSALQPQDLPPDSTNKSIQPMANSAAQQQVMPQLMSQMVDLLQKMSTMQQKMQNQQSSSTTSISSSSNSGSRRCRITNISFYCWSHGACAHPSAEYKIKRPGHQDAAMFENKRGGYTVYCVVINENS